TKMYVSDIDNSNNDNGIVSIRNAEKNKMGENYLLNFDWFLGDANIDGLQSKNLIPEDLSWTIVPYYEIGETGAEQTITGPENIINAFKDSVGKYNKDIKDLQLQATNLQKKIENLTGEYNYEESSYNAALTTKNQEIQKLKLIPDEAIEKVEKKYAYLKNDNWLLSFSSQGVKDTSIVLHADDGTEIAYEITKRDPIVRFSVLEVKLLNVDPEWASNSVLRVDVEYTQSTKSFLEYLVNYYQNIIDDAQNRMTRIGKDISFGGLGELAGTQTTLALVKTNLRNRKQNKEAISSSFEKIMSPFIREGYWEDTSYATYVKQETPIVRAYPTNNLFKTSELQEENWTKFTDSLRDVFLIPNLQLKTIYTDEANSSNNKYLWLYDVIDLDTIEIFDKDSAGEYNQYSNTEFSIDYAQARIAAETTPSFAKGIYIWFLKDYSNPENTYLENDNIYIRFKLRGQNDYYEAVYDEGEFYLDLLKLNSDKFGNPQETAQNFISVCPIEMTYKINATNVVLPTVSIQLNTVDPTDLLSSKTYDLTYGYDYTVAKIENEVAGTIETVVTFVNKNVLAPLILNQNNVTNYTIRYQTDTTEGYYFNDAETKMSENCIPQVDYQINTIDLSKTLVESQERIIEEEAGTIITGTDIAITDNTKPTGRITGFECASVQNGTPSPDTPIPVNSTGDGGVVNVWSHRKNLLKPTLENSTTVNGVTLTNNHDGTFTLNGTANTTSAVRIYNGIAKKIVMHNGKSYTFSTNVIQGDFGRSTFTFAVYNPDNTVRYNFMNTTKNVSTNTKLMTWDTPVQGIAVYFVEGTTFNNVVFNIQLQEGTATPYEPYTGNEYPITLPVGYVGGSLPNGVKDTNTMQYMKSITFSGQSVTIPDMKSNGSFWSTRGGTLVDKTITLDSVPSGDTTIEYELETPIPITLALPLINTYGGYNKIECTNAVKPNLTLNYNYVPYQLIGRTQEELQKFNSEFYKPKIGARALINDKELKLKNVVGIITSLIKNYNNPSENSIVIANYKDKFKDLFQRISAATAQVENNGAYYEKATKTVNSKGQIPQDIFKETILNNDFVLSKTQDNLLTWGTMGIVATDRRLNENGVYGQLRITSGGIFVANSKDENGNYIWTTGMTPDYINADLLTAGTINTKNIKLYNDDYQR
ncbi:MAG: hypothetical protein PHC75_10345, partial [Burkholderiales bacterium]|nr:hypothetical protein [Burkholderiales bacterium]